MSKYMEYIHESGQKNVSGLLWREGYLGPQLYQCQWKKRSASMSEPVCLSTSYKQVFLFRL